MALPVDKRQAVKVMLVVMLIAVLPMIWVWTPLSRWLNFDTIVYWQETLKHYPGVFFFVMGVYLVAGIVLFPMSILNVATILTFGPIEGNVYALAGWLLSGSMGYAVGRALGHDTLRKLVGPRLDLLIHRAGRHGFLTVLTIRVLPIAPFTVGNLFIGSSGIRFRDFIAGSILGRIPGMILMTVAGVQIENALRNPAVGTVIVVVVVLVLIPLATGWIARRLHRSESRRVRSAS
ncbi:MAG TPA: VTT domain-containing protein [Candidatus Binatia bacterium]|nr:VTT domain-containing protein [Candidatus Binatia bacterium]